MTTVDEFIGDEFFWADGRRKPITLRTACRRTLPHITNFISMRAEANRG